jgi:hypothetical protein
MLTAAERRRLREAIDVASRERVRTAARFDGRAPNVELQPERFRQCEGIKENAERCAAPAKEGLRFCGTHQRKVDLETWPTVVPVDNWPPGV